MPCRDVHTFVFKILNTIMQFVFLFEILLETEYFVFVFEILLQKVLSNRNRFFGSILHSTEYT